MEVLRRLKLVKPSNKEVEARQKQLKTLFSYRKGPVQGFYPNASCFAFDAPLGFLAVCTETGSIDVIGKFAVQFHAQHPDKVKIDKVLFLKEQGRLLTLASNWSVHKWEMNTTSDGTPTLTCVGSLFHPSKESLKKWVYCLCKDDKKLYVVDHEENVIKIDVDEMKLVEDFKIKKEDIIKIASDEQKSKMVTTNCLLCHPSHPNKLLVGYEEGMLVLWNEQASRSERCFGSSQSLQDASFTRDGLSLVTAHSDGSHMTWSMDDVMKNVENAVTYPYGPFPCRDISKIVLKTSNKQQAPYLVFAGGLPRATFAQKHSVTVACGGKQVVFDLSSRFLDFIVVGEADESNCQDFKAPDNPHTLYILTSEEILLVDLSSPDWPLVHNFTGHHSDVTCMQSVSDVSQNVWIKLDCLRRKYLSLGNYHSAAWPLKGGSTLVSDKEDNHLLITGHQNGDVVFWKTSMGQVKKLFVWSTADVFELDLSPIKSPTQPHDDNWPPFRETTYKTDKGKDDERLSINQLLFDVQTGTLIVGGASGQVLVAGIEGEEVAVLPSQVETIALMGTEVDECHLDLNESYKGLLSVKHALQVDALFPCTSLSFKSHLQLLAIGTTNGFCLYDLLKNKVVLIRRTVSSARGMNRSRSFQQSVRESFRGLKRKSLPSSPAHKHKEIVEEKKEEEKKEEEKKEEEKKEEDKKGEEEKKVEEEKKEEEGKKDAEAKTVTSELKDHKIEQMGDAKKVEIVTSVSKTSATVVTKTTTKKDGETTTVTTETTEKTNDDVPAEKVVEEKAVEKTEEKTPDEVLASVEKEVKVEASKACTLKRGVNFDTPTKGVSSHLGDTSVTCIRLTNAQLTNATESGSTTLWVGLNDGSIYGYQVVVPCQSARQEEDVSALLAKEIHLKHGAAICELLVIDDQGSEVVVIDGEDDKKKEEKEDVVEVVAEEKKEEMKEVIKEVEEKKKEEEKKEEEPKSEGDKKEATEEKKEEEVKKEEVKEEDKSKEGDKTKTAEKPKVLNQRLLVCSKEQIKIFSLPGLKALTKHKVFRGKDEGYISYAFVTPFVSSEDTSYSESTLVCLTNNPEVTTLNLPSLKTQVKVTALSQPSSPFYAHLGHGRLIYMPSRQQLASFSLSTTHKAAPGVVLNLKEGMRVKPKVEEEVKEEAPKTEEVVVNGVHEKEAPTVTPEETSKHTPTEPEKKEVKEEEKKAEMPKEIILDVKKYSTTTSTTTTIQNEDLLEDSVKDHFADEGETVMVMTSHDVMENKMTIKTTTHTLTDCHGDQTQTTTVTKETTSTTQSGNFQDGMPQEAPKVA